MELSAVISYLQSASHEKVSKALDVLEHYNSPLNEKELTQLTNFQKLCEEELSAGLKVSDPSPSIREYSIRPVASISPFTVLQCIVSTSKIPNFPYDCQRRLLKKLLPRISKESKITVNEWYSLLRSASLLPIRTSKTSLCCVEALLTASLHTLFEVSSSSRQSCGIVAPSNETENGSLDAQDKNGVAVSNRKDVSLEAQALFCKLLAALCHNYAFSGYTKQEQLPTQRFLQTGEILSSSPSIPRALKEMKKMVMLISKNDPETLTAVLPKLNDTECITLCVLSGGVKPIDFSKDGVISCIKAEPGYLSSLLFYFPLDAICGSKIDDILTLCMYSIGLTSTSVRMFADFIRVIGSLLSLGGNVYFLKNGKDSFSQLLMPFVNNSKVLDTKVADIASVLYARIISKLDVMSNTQLWVSFCEALTAIITTKCRAASEKASVFTLASAMVSAIPLPARLSLDRTGLAALLNHEISTAATEATGPALRLLSLLQVESLAASGIQDALRLAKKDPLMKRALLLHMSPNCSESSLVENLSWELITESAEVEVIRPDAYLALIFVIGSKRGEIENYIPTLSTEDVLSQLILSECEMNRVADVAISLAKAELYDPLVMLLTHKSGFLSWKLRKFIETMDLDQHKVSSLWRSLMRSVFGVDSPTPMKILSPTASNALGRIAPFLFKHKNQAGLPNFIAEFLLCCGHQHIQGDDPLFYCYKKDVCSLYHRSSSFLNIKLAQRILFQCDGKKLLSVHAGSIMDKLTRFMNSPNHIRIASSKAIVMMASVLSSLFCPDIFQKMLHQLRESTTYFEGLDDLDKAIACDSPIAILEYENQVLKNRQILKNYPDRPPKGMSVDDFEDMKRKDSQVLTKAREALHTEVEKRKAAISESIQRHKTPFITVRLLGTTGLFSMEAISILYPYVQSIINQRDAPSALWDLCCDALEGLLFHTPLGNLAGAIVTTIARLFHEQSLTSSDVSQISSMAHYLRQSLTKMISPPLLVVLSELCRVAFKCGKASHSSRFTISISTQHQLMGILLQSMGQPHLPYPAKLLDLFVYILQGFPSLYKSVQLGVQMLIPLTVPEDLEILEKCCFMRSESVKEVIAASFSRFSNFLTCRRALVMAMVFTFDESPSVQQCMLDLVKDPSYSFSLEASDWGNLLSFLSLYGQEKPNATIVARAMKKLFQSTAATEEQQGKWIKDIVAITGSAPIVALQELSGSYKGQAPIWVMDFLCSETESPSTNENLMKMILQSGKTILSDCSIDTLGLMAPQLRGRLGKPPKDLSPPQKEIYMATVTVWLTIMSCRLQETVLLESIIEQQTSVLSNSTSAMVHRCVCDSMAEITSSEKVRESEKLDQFVEKCMKQVIHSGSYIKKKAHAWGIVGVLKGLGLTSIRRYNIMDVVMSATLDKKVELSGVMILLELMCEVLGTVFEPYALLASSLLLEGAADKDSKISECADDASKALMSSLSVVGLRQIIPFLVDGLSANHAKKKVPPLNFIGYVAFCSPKQLAATLPEIMKHITPCLFDVNNSVSSAAFNALRRVAGVVSNSEIKEHIDVILNAMRSPSTETEKALDTLLYTRFTSLIDPASLALIIPVLSRGLSNQMTHTRAKAAQIIGSMVSLVSDPNALSPYCDELLSLLEAAAQDPKPESRATSAKAIAALAQVVGRSKIDEIVTWCFSELQKTNNNAIEKAGAAQVFTEVVSASGIELLQAYFPTIEAGMRDSRPPVREGFLYIMVYSPSTFPTETFQGFLSISFPWVLDGLSHFSERVRDVALSAGTTIILLHGTRNLSFVLDPLLDGVVSDVSNLRNSSLILSSKLLLHLVSNIKHRSRRLGEEESGTVAPEAENTTTQEDAVGISEEVTEESAVMTYESARDNEKRGISILGALEEDLGTQQFITLFSAIWIGRNEHNASVRNDANTAWHACIARVRTAIKKIFNGLVQLLVKHSSSQNPDCVEAAQKTVEVTCRISETIEWFIDSLCDIYKVSDERGKLGALICLGSVVPFADSKKLISMGGQVVACVLPGMQVHDPDVQSAARSVFAKVSKSVGPRLIESAVETQLDTSARGVVEVVKVKPNVALPLVFKLLARHSSFTDVHLDLLDSILDVEEIMVELKRYNESIASILLECLVQGLEGASEVTEKFVSGLSSEYENVPFEVFQKALRVPRTQLGGLLVAEACGTGSQLTNVEGINEVFRVVLDSLGSENDLVRNEAVRILPQLISSIEERVIEDMEEEEQQDVTTSKRAASRYLLQYLEVFQTTLSVTARAAITAEKPYFSILAAGSPRLFDSLMSFYNRGLDYGTPQQKIEAVECIQDLLEFAPPDLSANSANTVAGRCSKVLFTRNDGSVVLALVRLCLKLMSYQNNGKEKMVESTMALAMFNAMLCDSGEARLLALRIVIQLLQKSEKYADLIIGTVVTKKNFVDNPLFRGAMCRFISVVMRYSNFEKAMIHIPKLMAIVQPLWEQASTPGTAVAAGIALGALCKSASINDETLSDLKERTLGITSTKGVHALAGFAFVYSIIACAPSRVDQNFLDIAAEHLQTAASSATGDKLSNMWILRAASAVANTKCVSMASFNPEVYLSLLSRVENTDEQLLSTANYFYESVTQAYPFCVTLFEAISREPSRQWLIVNHFDADLDDEVIADTIL